MVLSYIAKYVYEMVLTDTLETSSTIPERVP